MGRLAKILLFILFLTIIGGTGVYLWQSQKQPPVSISLPPKTATKSGFPRPPAIPETVEIKGLALFGNLNLLEITKSQAEKWATSSGLVTVPAYAGPLPTIPTELATLSGQLQPVKLPATTKVLAGYFKKTTANGGLAISQDQKEVSVGVNEGARLWLKEQDKLQIVPSFLTDLISSGNFSQFVEENNLLLLVDPSQEAGQFKISVLVVFK